MREKFIFQIHPLTLDEGFEVACEGIMEHPLRVERIFEAVVLATQLGQDSISRFRESWCWRIRDEDDHPNTRQ